VNLVIGEGRRQWSVLFLCNTIELRLKKCPMTAERILEAIRKKVSTIRNSPLGISVMDEGYRRNRFYEQAERR